MALTEDTPRTYELGDVNELPVAASTTIYEGSAVGDNGSGYARPLQAGDPFRGFAEAKVDNSTGSAGDKNVRVLTRGKIKASISGLAITDVGADIYMSDDGTFTKTAGSNTRIGVVHRWVSSGVGIVAFDVAETQTVGTSEIAADAITSAKIADDAVSLEHLDSGITPTHIVVAAGEHTTTGGGASEEITVTGATSSDLAVCVLKTQGATPRVIKTAAAGTNKITVTFDGDPSTDHVVTYLLLRAAS